MMTWLLHLVVVAVAASAVVVGLAQEAFLQVEEHLAMVTTME